MGAKVAAAVDFGREGSDSVATSRVRHKQGRPRRRIAESHVLLPCSDMCWHICIHKHSHVMILYTVVITYLTRHNKGSHMVAVARV
jgi:hypothetical protein